jgi:outer membrane protein with beta-barrel domain
MIHRWRGVAALLALAAMAPPAAAQVRGIPVYNSGVPRGIGLYGDVGFSNDEAGGGTGWGLTGKAGLGPLGVTALISTSKPDGGDSDVSLGATLNYRLFGGPLVPLAVTLQAGAGWVKAEGADLLVLPPPDVTTWHFPIGVGFTLTIPNPVLAIRPWLAPRLDIVRHSAGGDSETDTNFGLSGGLEANFLNGFGLHAAYDAVFADGATPGVFGLGAHYAFRTPGL